MKWIEAGSISHMARNVGPRGMRPRTVLVAIAVVLLMVPPTAVFASGGSSSLPAESPVEGSLTDPQVAAELPHTDLEREEVVDLLAGVFEVQLESPAGPFDDLAVEQFLTANAALISGDDRPELSGLAVGKTTDSAADETLLLESSIPLRKEGEVVDLSLEREGSVLRSANPLVEVVLPTELGESMRLPGTGISISLAGAPAARAPSLVENTAIYPNVSADSDLIAAPTPMGLETMTTLRGPDAPLSQTYVLDLPEGARLREDERGAAVEMDAETLLRVPEPFALDAAGNQVPTTLSVSGNSVVVRTTPQPNTAWPILVDPMWEYFSWYASGYPIEWAGWQTESSNTPGLGSGFVTSSTTPYTGLNVVAQPGSYGPGSKEKMTREVPRLRQEEAVGNKPTSYFTRMTLTNVTVKTSGGSPAPYALAGIWDVSTNYWAGIAPGYSHWSMGLNGGGIANATISITGAGSHDAKIGVALGLQSNENASVALPKREIFVGGVSFEVGDDDSPELANPSGSAWVNAVAKEAISVVVKDPGLGAKTARFSIPGHEKVTVQHPCVGTAPSPCPAKWTASVSPSQYNPSLMPQGETSVPIIGEDVLGKSSPPGNAQVLVDHTKPSLALSGTLTEQAKVGTGLAQYSLKYDAADGDSSAAAAQAPFGTAGTGVGQLQRPMGIALDSAGNSYVVDRECRCVQKYDSTGKFVLQFGTPGTGNGQFTDPRGIAVSSEGVWVADYVTKAVQLFGFGGSFIRKLSHNFVNPYAVAVGPGNALWVSDTGVHTVYKFANATGTGVAVHGTNAAPNGAGTDLNWPIGLATHEAGGVWVSDAGHNRVVGYDASGKWVGEFGSPGSGNGQFKQPFGLAVAPSTGNVLVADEENGRIQEFRFNGEYIRHFGSAGAANNQFSLPRGIALGPDRTLYVAESGNKRIAKWTHASYDPQSGAASTEVKIDGNLVDPKHAPGCAIKDCAISREWTLKADDFSVGQHTLEVTATDGVGLATTKAMTIETHGDLTPPAVSLTGSITEQASLGTTRPSYKVHAVASDPGGAEERKSGAASLVIKVDGTTVDSTSPGCPAGDCSLAQLWTLNSDSYAVGSHTVQVIATDAAGRVTTKSHNFTINRDTTAPEIDTSSGWNTLFNRPEGWVEQKKYIYFPQVKDPNGYGTTSVSFKFDGATIATKNQTCSQGSCEAFVAGELNMANYDGGAHGAEVVATDGAGNTRKRTWTINVSPAGGVSVSEATDTLEAMEETVPNEHEFLPVAPTPEYLEQQVIEAGDNPHFKEVAGDIESTGVTVDTTFDSDSDALTIEGTEGSLELTPAIPIQQPEIVSGAALVLPSAAVGADTIVRPEYDGAVMFTTIRDAAAPELYEWRLKLHQGQYLVQANPQQIEVKWGSGATAFLVTADPAHDATGKAVPTSLSIINSTDIALQVPHRNQGFTYPVSAGQSYETGYAIVTVYIPDPEEAIDPMTPEEGIDLSDDVANGFLQSAGPLPFSSQSKQRNRNKPVTRKQARRLMRAKTQGLRAPAPEAGPSGGPGSCCEKPWRAVETAGKVASDFNEEIWDVEIQDGTFRKTDSYVAVGPHTTEPKCDDDVLWYWKLNLLISNQAGIDHLGPGIAWRGSGQHLTYRCTYSIFIGPIPEEYVMEAQNELQLLVYPNGYQTSRATEIDVRVYKDLW